VRDTSVILPGAEWVSGLPLARHMQNCTYRNGAPQNLDPPEIYRLVPLVIRRQAMGWPD